MSFQIILIIHVLLALGLIALILMQHGKGADAGAAFGAGASGSVFGARGANSFMYKLTASIATAFFVTSLTLAYLATNETATDKEPASIMEVQSNPTDLVPSDVPMIVPLSTVTNSSDIPE
jgi:preprotein translocase subunit SecG